MVHLVQISRRRQHLQQVDVDVVNTALQKGRRRGRRGVARVDNMVMCLVLFKQKVLLRNMRLQSGLILLKLLQLHFVERMSGCTCFTCTFCRRRGKRGNRMVMLVRKSNSTLLSSSWTSTTFRRNNLPAGLLPPPPLGRGALLPQPLLDFHPNVLPIHLLPVRRLLLLRRYGSTAAAAAAAVTLIIGPILLPVGSLHQLQEPSTPGSAQFVVYLVGHHLLLAEGFA